MAENIFQCNKWINREKLKNMKWLAKQGVRENFKISLAREVDNEYGITQGKK